LLCLIACSLAGGFLLGGSDDEDVVRTAQLRAGSTKRALRDEAHALRATRALGGDLPPALVPWHVR